MRPRLHFRVLFWNVLLIGLTVVVLDSILSTSLRAYLENQVEQQLKRETSVAAAFLALDRVRESIDDATDKLSGMLGLRVTFIDRDGRVLGDSELDREALQTVENHSERPEVREARAGGTGRSIRYSTTVHSNYMYVATRLPEGYLRLAMPLTAMEALVRGLRWQLFYASVIALVLTLVFSYAVARRISQPIRQIALGARRLATGDLDYRLPTGKSDDEIAALASALNTMAQNLSSKMQELSEGKERLEWTEKMRRDFVANVSHEFKTPLTSIRGYAETLLAGADDNQEVRVHFLTVIERNARHLESLVRDLLHLAKIEAELPARKEQVDLQSLIDEQVSARQTALEEHEIKVAVDCPEITLQCDRSRLSAAVSNLIDNAIHYNRRGGQINISGHLENGRGFTLDIADTGYGIPEQELPRIFERFYRVDKARSRESGGTGLGLAIAKHAIESQGGKITVASTVGKGSIFTIRLPS